MTREEIHALPWKAQEHINELERNQLKMYTLKLDIKTMVADYENGRITDHELIDFLKEITAE